MIEYFLNKYEVLFEINLKGGRLFDFFLMAMHLCYFSPIKSTHFHDISYCIPELKTTTTESSFYIICQLSPTVFHLACAVNKQIYCSTACECMSECVHVCIHTAINKHHFHTQVLFQVYELFLETAFLLNAIVQFFSSSTLFRFVPWIHHKNYCHQFLVNSWGSWNCL